MNFLHWWALIASKSSAVSTAASNLKRAPQPLDPAVVEQWMSISVWSMMGLNLLALLFFLGAYITPQLKFISAFFASQWNAHKERRAAKVKARSEAIAAKKPAEAEAKPKANVTGLEDLPPPDADVPASASLTPADAPMAPTAASSPPSTDVVPSTAAPTADAVADVTEVIDIDMINKALAEGPNTALAEEQNSIAQRVNSTLDQGSIDQLLTSVIEDSSAVETTATQQPAEAQSPAPTPVISTEGYFDLSFIDQALQSVDLSQVIEQAIAERPISTHLDPSVLNSSSTWPPPGLADNSLQEYFNVDMINEKIGAVDLTPLPSAGLVESIIQDTPAAREPFVEKTEPFIPAPAVSAPPKDPAPISTQPTPAAEAPAAAVSAGPAKPVIENVSSEDVDALLAAVSQAGERENEIVNSQVQDPNTLAAIASFEKTLDDALNTLGDKTEEVPIFDSSLIDQALQDSGDTPRVEGGIKGNA